ncbi:MAG: phasin family protein [Alphaproteobacteria bacterium]
MSAETSPIADIPSGVATNEKKPATKRPEAVPPRKAAQRPNVLQDTQPGWPNVDVVKFFDESRERLKEAFEQANGRFDHVRHAARDTSEVLQDCHSATISGLKEISEQTLEHLQADVDRLFDLGRSMTDAKSLPELLQIQGDFLRESIEQNLARTKTMGELTANLFKTTCEPLQTGIANVISQARKRAG